MCWADYQCLRRSVLKMSRREICRLWHMVAFVVKIGCTHPFSSGGSFVGVWGDDMPNNWKLQATLRFLSKFRCEVLSGLGCGLVLGLILFGLILKASRWLLLVDLCWSFWTGYWIPREADWRPIKDFGYVCQESVSRDFIWVFRTRVEKYPKVTPYPINTLRTNENSWEP